MKKPKLQVLLEAFPSHDLPNGCMALKLWKDGVQKASFCTSHQLFQQFALQTPARGQDHKRLRVSFVIHEYRVNPFRSLCEVKTTKVSSSQLLSSKQRCSNRGQKTKLPFGLTMPKRKRKQPATGSGTLAGNTVQKKSRATSSSATEVDAKNAEQNHQDAFKDFSDVQIEHMSHSSSESDSGVAGGSDTSSGSESDGEVEVPIMTPEERKEEEQTQRILRKHEEESAKNASSSADNASSSTASQPSHRPGPISVTCRDTLGLVDVAVQLHRKLAMCRHCASNIEIGCVRFAYSWNKSKFPSWLHATCTLAHLLQEEADVRQAVCFLQTKLDENVQSEDVKHAIESLLGDLSTQAAQLLGKSVKPPGASLILVASPASGHYLALL